MCHIHHFGYVQGVCVLKLDVNLSLFLITEARPLHTVTRPSFRLLVRVLNPRVRPLSKRRVRRLVVQKYKAFKCKIIAATANISFICLTADIWTGRNRSFLGVTAHWLDSKLNRVSAAIACKRFKGDFH